MAQARSSSAASAASSRPRQTSTTSRPPLESLIYTLVPSLAPPRRSALGTDRSGAASRASTVGSRADGTSTDEVEKERERRSTVRELVDWCERTIDSELPSTASATGLAGSALPDAAKRMLARTGERGGSSSNDKALKFGGLWNKLEKGKTLSSPLPHLQFLMALSSLDKIESSGTFGPAGKGQMLPPSVPAPVNQAPPPASAAASSSRQAIQETHVNVPAAEWKGKGKSKADMLRAWRSAQGLPAHLAVVPC